MALDPPVGWEFVTREETREIWDEQERRKILYNGCTIAALVNRYGRDNVRHVSGRGWIKRRGALRNTNENFGGFA